MTPDPTAVAAAIRATWSLDTCDPSDVADWTPDNPARGQCGVTALTLHDLYGGELLVAEVLRPDGSRQGFHYWNRLPGGEEVDLTAVQFTPDEIVQPPTVSERPAGPPRRAADEYARFRRRVFDTLGLP